MKIRFTSPQGRAALTLLCLVTTALAFWTGLFTASQWDNLWSGGDYIHSHSISPLHCFYIILTYLTFYVKQRDGVSQLLHQCFLEH